MFEVTNQPPPLEPYNLFASDTVLREAVVREGAVGARRAQRARRHAWHTGNQQLGFDANRYPPTLRSFDRYGHRIDEVDFYPAWHTMLGLAVKAGLHSSPWADPKARRACGARRRQLHAQ